MKPEKLQTIFIHWLNAALQDPRWRAFIRARLTESELPVIEVANGRKILTKSERNLAYRGAHDGDRIREKLVNHDCKRTA